MTREDLRHQGEAMRDKLRGDGTRPAARLRHLADRGVFGGIWSRPGLALPIA